MSGDSSPPTDQVNWEAYSHEELHRMLWQKADVADVSTVAEEWTRHRAALVTHAEVLREQRTALLADWQGPAAEEAAARLAALADRIEKIGGLAFAGQRAAQDAADALATARAAMPPPPVPPVDPAGAVNAHVNGPANVHGPGTSLFGAPPAPAVNADGPEAPLFGAPTAPAFAPPPPPPPLALPPAPSFSPAPAPAFNLPTMPATFSPASFDPGTGSGFSFYFGVASADQQKAQAVRAMQTYESSLNGSSRLIDDARGTGPQSVSPAAGPAAPAPARATAGGGVPWQKLVGGSGGGGTPRGMSPVFGAPASQVSNPAAQLAPGMRAGVMFGVTGGPAGMAGPIADASARAASQNGVMPPPGGAAARGDDDQPHENQMPTLDHGLFDLDERACPPVIGETTGVES